LALAVQPAFLTALGSETLAALLRASPAPNTHRRIALGLTINIRDLVKSIAAPTLIIRGACDVLIPEYQTRVLHELIRDSQYVAVDSGHGVFLEQPDAVCNFVVEFLEA
jgi:pimeloyl-ACP methyl ester carboxylesterase